MKYTNEIIIDLPRDQMIEKLDNPENMKYWQEGLISHEHIEGEPGQVGAKMKLKYKMGKREVEMIETITKRNFPDEFHGTYDAGVVFNRQWNYFREEGDKTRWISETEFEFRGFMKVMAFFMGKKTFQKQSMKYLEDFKAFAEGNPRHGQE